eukprot:6839164-Prymnesium_polylepis.3
MSAQPSVMLTRSHRSSAVVFDATATSSSALQRSAATSRGGARPRNGRCLSSCLPLADRAAHGASSRTASTSGERTAAPHVRRPHTFAAPGAPRVSRPLAARGWRTARRNGF